LAVTADPAALVEALARSMGAQTIETHISWILLTGKFAYKFKKPVRLPFVDYSTLEARRHFCEEEIRLNRRLAPSLYLGVSRVAGTLQAPRLDGADGPALEYAVCMRRFPAGALFDEQMQEGHLRPDEVDRFAALVAGFHAQAPRAGVGDGYASPRMRRSAPLSALEGLRTLAGASEYAHLQAWLETEAAALEPMWESRLAQGWVREGHGDLHLSNVVSCDGEVLAFDCVEFNPSLRWIDVVDDSAFAVMDFCALGRTDFAYRFLNGWLDHLGDHDGLQMLRYAVVYRALVRSLAAQLRGNQEPLARNYLSTALNWTASGQPRLTITHGLPGSGKTHASQALLERQGAIRLRSDVERKRLFGLGMLDDSRQKGLDLYGAEAGARTYQHLLATARKLLLAGYPVILDAAFLRREERGRALALAQELSVPFSILACEAPLAVLHARLRARRGDASEADSNVLEQLRPVAEPLTAQELAFVEAPAAAGA
jgi:aminoglycoside phosphotransferase family enzyme/predicted kinase